MGHDAAKDMGEAIDIVRYTLYTYKSCYILFTHVYIYMYMIVYACVCVCARAYKREIGRERERHTVYGPRDG